MIDKANNDTTTHDEPDARSASVQRIPVSHLRWWLYAATMITVILPAALGFAHKFIRLIQTAKTDPDGGFALLPVTIYAAVTLGFLCLLVWAVTNGMFRDVEKLKYTMLEREAALDRQSSKSRSLYP